MEKSSISILDPSDIRSKHDAAIGNFGVPDYGGSMVGTVVYPDTGATGCSPFEGDKPFRSKSSTPTILLLDRGGNHQLSSSPVAFPGAIFFFVSFIHLHVFM